MNWRESVEVELECKTDIITARDGNEQRRSLRRTPRRRIAFSSTLLVAETLRLHQLLNRWQSRPWLLADPTRRVICPEGAAAGFNQIAVDRAPSWMVAGQTVVIGEVVTVIATIDSDTLVLTLDVDLPQTIPAGSEMRPALSGLLKGSITATHPTNGVTELRIDFAVDPGSEAADDGAAGLHVHAGREVLTLKPNWGEAVTTEASWDNEQVDFGFGRIATFNPTAFGAMTRRAVYVQRTAADAEDLARFFSRYRGQAGEFLMPTWLNDLPPRFDLIAGTTFIRVAGTDTADAYTDDPIYRTLVIVTKDDRRIYRTVLDITIVTDMDGTDTLLSLDAEFFDDIPLSNIAMVSWMPVVRFASDQITVEWLTDEVAQSVAALRTLPYLEAEDPVPEYDEAARWVLETWGDGVVDDFDAIHHTLHVEYGEAV